MFLSPEKANNNIWHDNPSNGICKARYDLFKACFEGFRNERAHNEYVNNEDALFELILLNYLLKITKFLNKRAEKQGENRQTSHHTVKILRNVLFLSKNLGIFIAI